MQDKTFNAVMRTTFLSVLMTLTGCQQRQSVTPPAVPRSQQLEQLASLTAATRYLKTRCQRSDLPDEPRVRVVANQMAVKKGWQPFSTDVLGKQSDALYQSLVRDSTPGQTQCSAFNRQLVPFITALQTESGDQ